MHSAFRRTLSKVDSGSLGNTGAKKSKIDGLSGSPGTGERPALYGGGRPRWSIGHDRAVGLLGGCCSALIEQSATIEQSASWAAATRPPGRRWTPAGLASLSPFPARRHRCCSAAEGPNGLRLSALLRPLPSLASPPLYPPPPTFSLLPKNLLYHPTSFPPPLPTPIPPLSAIPLNPLRLRSATTEDRGTPGTGERLTLHGCGRRRWRIAAARYRERGSRCMVAVGHNGGSRQVRPGTEEAHAARRRSATMEDHSSLGSGERLTLHGGGRPRWRRITVARKRERGSRCMAAVGHDGESRGCYAGDGPAVSSCARKV